MFAILPLQYLVKAKRPSMMHGHFFQKLQKCLKSLRIYSKKVKYMKKDTALLEQ